MGQQLHRGRRSRAKKRKMILPILAVLVATALAIGVVVVTLSKDPDNNTSSTVVSDEPKPAEKTLPKSFIDRNTSSPYVILGDITSDKILYSKNADKKCYPASLTKLLTAIVALENASADTVLTVGDEIYMIDPQSSRAYLTVGTRLTLEQLLQAMLLPSGNDAAYSVAVQIGRLIANDESLDKQTAINRFCKKMNDKAAALGCKNSHFCNPDGIHESEHYTTAADMLKIAACALQNKTIASVVSSPKVQTTLLSGQTVTWVNTNRLIQEDNAFSFAGATGLKTGSTDQAGYCLAASATRGGKTCVAIVMGSEVENGRWADASGLLDISFQ